MFFCVSSYKFDYVLWVSDKVGPASVLWESTLFIVWAVELCDPLEN